MNLQEQISRIQQIIILFEDKKKPKHIQWVKPNMEKEEGEFDGHFLPWLEDDVYKTNFDNYSDEKLKKLMDSIDLAYENAKIEYLTDEEWSIMENTDSWNINTMEDLFNIISGYWGRDKERIIKYSLEPIKNGGVVETPIVAYAKGHPPYLVAGNTRLSVCKALNIRPKVTKIKIK